MSETFTAHLSTIINRMDSLAKCMDSVENRGRPRSPSLSSGSETYTPGPAPVSWADRHPNKRLIIDPNKVLTWADEDDEENNANQSGCHLYRVSLATESLLRDFFSRSIPNATRRCWRKVCGMPSGRFTKCPKLDTTLKSKLPKQSKDADRPLARPRHYCSMQLGPLSTCWSNYTSLQTSGKQ